MVQSHGYSSSYRRTWIMTPRILYANQQQFYVRISGDYNIQRLKTIWAILRLHSIEWAKTKWTESEKPQLRETCNGKCCVRCTFELSRKMLLQNIWLHCTVYSFLRKWRTSHVDVQKLAPKFWIHPAKMHISMNKARRRGTVSFDANDSMIWKNN